jgi:outer membrane protein assembly factor BamB
MTMAAPLARALGAALAALLVAGCSTTSTSAWNPMTWSLPAPSWDWFSDRGKANKPGPLPTLTATANATIAWQASVGRARPGLAPAVTANAIYAAASDGTLARLEPDTGRSVWRIAAGKPLSAGPGADATLVAVGTDKGEVLAFDPDGKPLWTAQITSEVLSPPVVADGVVVVSSGDGRIFGIAAADGKTKWVHQRTNPPLTVRNTAGGLASRGGVFVGLPGGRLLAMDVQTGTIGWDGAVASPKGATELERIADVTSRPVVEERQACAVAYQGRLACFEIVRGALTWTRELSSLAGIAADATAFYVIDEKGAVHALDKSTGASLWKQEALAERRLRATQVVGEFVAVLDVEGYVHLLAKGTGAYVGRTATDGSAPTGQPFAVGDRIVWLSMSGTVFAVGAR